MAQPKKPIAEDRQRQVATTKARHGEDHYGKIGAKGHKYDSDKARLAALKRWHPEYFDEDGNLIKETTDGNHS